MEIHPTDYDLIVLGTGLEESIVAAAAATSGLSVLHLDNESEYGSQWAGLGIEEFLARLRSSESASTSSSQNEQASEPSSDTEEMQIRCPRSSIYSNVEIFQNAQDNHVFKQNVIDLAPKVLYTSGSMVDALLRLGAETYLVFRLVRSYFLQDGDLKDVPASRADIFKSKDLKPADKRSLMRFLKAALEARQGQGPLKDALGTTPFVQLLGQEKLPFELQSVILYSLAMLDSRQQLAGTKARHQGVPEEQNGSEGTASAKQSIPGEGMSPCTAQEGLDRMSRFVDSANEQGGAFMVPDYGLGELPQAFCRVAAVAGATYVLRAGVVSLLIDKAHRQCKGVRLANGQTLACRALAANSDFLPPEFLSRALNSPSISRAVVICESFALKQSNSPQRDQSLLTVFPLALSVDSPANPVRALQLGQRSLVAPEDRHILYFSTACQGHAASEDLKAIVDNLLQGPEEAVLLKAYYNQECYVDSSPALPSNVAICQPPGLEIGYAKVMEDARASYVKLFGTREFLPERLRPQDDPDDIDLGG